MTEPKAKKSKAPKDPKEPKKPRARKTPVAGTPAAAADVRTPDSAPVERGPDVSGDIPQQPPEHEPYTPIPVAGIAHKLEAVAPVVVAPSESAVVAPESAVVAPIVVAPEPAIVAAVVVAPEPAIVAPVEPAVAAPEPALVPEPPPEPVRVVRDELAPTPEDAAMEAVRMVSEIVDIDTPTGAVIAATIAAQAASMASPSASSGDSGDPVNTVRLSRERILAALAAEAQSDAAGGTAEAVPIRARTEPPIRARTEPPVRARTEPPVRARTEPPVRARTEPPVRARTEPPIRARTEPAVEPELPHVDPEAEPGDEIVELDPVQIAAAAIQRLRRRARTDLAELRVHYRRHDILVVILAFIIIVVAGRVYYRLVAPQTATFNEHGLTFIHPLLLHPRETLLPPSPRLARDAGGPPQPDEALFHIELTVDAAARIEVLIDKKPTWSNIVTGLDLDRRTRWGELYKLDDSSVRAIAGHDWLRTAYRYAHGERTDVPRVDTAIEYATIDRDQIYVITLFGGAPQLDRLEDIVVPSLRVATQTGLPLVPQTGRLSQRTYPNAVARAFESTVMIVVADLVDGRLKPRGGGSGVIVGADGSILTNFHVIHDKDGRLHDVFVIGRFADGDRAPQLACAGRPSRSKLQRELDLALLKCDLDLDGRAWNPATGGGIWATLREAHSEDVKMGQRLWVLGYPDVGGGGLTLSEGDVEGWTGEDGANGRDFIKTDASITHGNSGGPVVDDQGRLVGIASAFRTKLTASGGIVETAQVGLVRPLSTASDLLAYASAGWTPRENHTEVELQPAVEAPAEGKRISTHIVDAANEAPVRDALVMVLRPGIGGSNVDMNRLDDQVISWGRSNAEGEVLLKQPVPAPGEYAVMVIAHGYELLIDQGAMKLTEKTPPNWDPWGKIRLQAR